MKRKPCLGLTVLMLGLFLVALPLAPALAGEAEKKAEAPAGAKAGLPGESRDRGGRETRWPRGQDRSARAGQPDAGRGRSPRGRGTADRR